jgi:hypothetical protein
MNEASLAIGMTISLRQELAGDAAGLCELPLDDFAEVMLMKTAYCDQACKLMRDLRIPSDEKEQIEWAIDKIRFAEHFIAGGQFELLGTARSIISKRAKSNSPRR